MNFLKNFEGAICSLWDVGAALILRQNLLKVYSFPAMLGLATGRYCLYLIQAVLLPFWPVCSWISLNLFVHCALSLKRNSSDICWSSCFCLSQWDPQKLTEASVPGWTWPVGRPSNNARAFPHPTTLFYTTNPFPQWGILLFLAWRT